jgi:predicted  nucleic acid-binding Zn-ribbon protein
MGSVASDSVISGTVVGAGSFSCEHCGYTLTLAASDMLTACPGCGGQVFARASLFSTERIPAGATGEVAAHSNDGELLKPPAPGRAERLAVARERIEQPGEYLSYEENGELRTVALTREWTRVGRSLAADVRFDDPTVSRRHALIVRHPDGVRLLDDRSLNGVFVNGARVDGKTLQDGDEIIVGRYRLAFLSIAADGEQSGADTSVPPLQSIG